MDDEELGAWLRLLETPGLGRRSVRALLAALGSPHAVLQARPAVLHELVGPQGAAQLAQPPEEEWVARWAQVREWRHAGSDRFVLSPGDSGYPQSLLDTPDPPMLLYAQGRLDWLNKPMLAIVGSRNATAQGVDNARQFARHLADHGWSVVSGLALGIDAAAHEGALQGAGGTVAVVGHGLDTVYPRRNAQLFEQIAECGLLLSEFAPGTPPLAQNFPQRNRIIAGMSAGTLVVEAALASGSLITARLAAESGREVFAIPGSIHSPLSRGCHALIRQGAKLVESAQDILEELGAASGRVAGPGARIDTARPGDPGRPEDISPHGPAGALLRALGGDPLSLDELGQRTGMSAAALGAQLLELEIEGQVARLPGGRFQRRHRG